MRYEISGLDNRNNIFDNFLMIKRVTMVTMMNKKMVQMKIMSKTMENMVMITMNKKMTKMKM